MARNAKCPDKVDCIIQLMITAETTNQCRVNGAEPADVWRARRFIEENSIEPISLSQVANAVNISPTHLSEKFKNVTGIKFVDYVAQQRYEKARALLHNPETRVSEIAFAAGFQSLSQFNRVFKKLSGESPRAYRRSIMKSPNRA
jgi:AraC-like DNA-binding protein